MNEFSIIRDNADQRAIKFTGELIAEIYEQGETTAITRLYKLADVGFVRESITLYLRTATRHLTPGCHNFLTCEC